MVFYFLDNQNALMMGAFMAPGSTELTRDEYRSLLTIQACHRPACLAELRKGMEQQ